MKDIYDEWLSPRPIKASQTSPPQLLPSAREAVGVMRQHHNQFLEMLLLQRKTHPKN
jgi:hypothetical protein